ncbi:MULTISPECIES: lysozyme [Paraburkholderia]|jgi:GH24 family phage-related lysozyme (muramidase)|uniref:lysozyme n=1 Tax=Paraburkholderia TaxID=1822464 RepID=UPI0011600340|nr:lysozyme [Paraburkholderia hospita]
MAQPRAVDDDTINLVHQFEGLPELAVANIHPHLDPVGIWTIGRGHAISPDGRFVRGNAGLDQVKTIITCSYVDGRLRRHWGRQDGRSEQTLSPCDLSSKKTIRPRHLDQ